MSEEAKSRMRNKKQSPESNRKRSDTLKGRVISEETKQKMSLVQKQRSLAAELSRRQKIREHATGRLHSEYTKKYLSSIASQIRWMNNGIDNIKVHRDKVEEKQQEGWVTGRIFRTVTCPHCGMSGVQHNIARSHFDKCKKKKDNNEHKE